MCITKTYGGKAKNHLQTKHTRRAKLHKTQLPLSQQHNELFLHKWKVKHIEMKTLQKSDKFHIPIQIRIYIIYDKRKWIRSSEPHPIRASGPNLSPYDSKTHFLNFHSSNKLKMKAWIKIHISAIILYVQLRLCTFFSAQAVPHSFVKLQPCM